jgi:hypothetical protein
MAIMDALGDKAKKIKDAYKAGGDESTGIGKELGEKARMMKDASGQPSDSPKPAPAGKPAPMKPVKGPYGSQPGEKRIDTSYPDSPMPKMHKGGMVKKTGPHMLLKGEAVLSKKDTKKVAALGGQPNAGPSDAPDGMSIDKMDDNTFQITHRHNTPEPNPEEPKRKTKFTARNVKHLVRHVRQHFGGGQQDDGMAEPSSFEEGGVVQKSGMAKVHKGEAVVPVNKAPVKSPDIYIGGKPASKAAPSPSTPTSVGMDPLNRPREQRMI